LRQCRGGRHRQRDGENACDNPFHEGLPLTPHCLQLHSVTAIMPHGTHSGKARGGGRPICVFPLSGMAKLVMPGLDPAMTKE